MRECEAVGSGLDSFSIRVEYTPFKFHLDRSCTSNAEQKSPVDRCCFKFRRNDAVEMRAYEQRKLIDNNSFTLPDEPRPNSRPEQSITVYQTVNFFVYSLPISLSL